MTSNRSPRSRPVRVVYLACQLLQASLLVAFLLASLVLSGAQVAASGEPAWSPAVAFPVFPVPAWLLVIPSALGTAAAIMWAVRAGRDESGALTGALGPTVAAALAAFYFMFALGEDGSPVSGFGWALAFAAASIVVLLVAGAVTHGRAQAAVQAGGAANGERSEAS